MTTQWNGAEIQKSNKINPGRAIGRGSSGHVPISEFAIGIARRLIGRRGTTSRRSSWGSAWRHTPWRAARPLLIRGPLKLHAEHHGTRILPQLILQCNVAIERAAANPTHEGRGAAANELILSCFFCIPHLQLPSTNATAHHGGIVQSQEVQLNHGQTQPTVISFSLVMSKMNVSPNLGLLPPPSAIFVLCSCDPMTSCRHRQVNVKKKAKRQGAMPHLHIGISLADQRGRAEVSATDHLHRQFAKALHGSATCG